jgi:hypothetical protein
MAMQAKLEVINADADFALRPLWCRATAESWRNSAQRNSVKTGVGNGPAKSPVGRRSSAVTTTNHTQSRLPPTLSHHGANQDLWRT